MRPSYTKNTMSVKTFFNIIDGSNLSLEKLHNIKKRKESILRSAHVGNFNPQTLVIANEKFPVILHEHLGSESRGYRPAFVFYNRKELQIAQDSNQLTCYLKFGTFFKKKQFFDDFRVLVGGKRLGELVKKPAQLHYFSLKSLFGTSIQSLSEYLLRHTDIIGDLIELFAKYKPRYFDRVITEKGEIFFFNNNNSVKIQYINPFTNKKIILQTKDISKIFLNYIQFIYDVISSKEEYTRTPLGLILNPLIYIILTSITEVYKNRPGIQRFDKKCVSIYHFSGSYMMKYLISDQSQALDNRIHLNDLYHLAAKNFSDKIPAKINFYLVPTEGLQLFVVPPAKKSLIENQCRQSWMIIRKKKPRITNVMDAINISPELFNFKEKYPPFSQYDLIMEKAEIHLPKSIKKKSMVEIEKMYTLLRDLSKGYNIKRNK